MNTLLSFNSITLDVILVAFLLAYLVGGMIKGFSNYLVGFIGTIAAFILAVIFCDDMVNLLKPTAGYEKIRLFFENLLPISQDANLESLGLPAFVINAVDSLIQATPSMPLYKAVSIALTNLLLTFVCFLVILLGVKIICFILKKILSVLTKLPIVGTVNRILGAIVGLINGALIISALIYIVAILPFPALDYFKSILNASAVAQFLSKYNIYALIFSIF